MNFKGRTVLVIIVCTTLLSSFFTWTMTKAWPTVGGNAIVTTGSTAGNRLTTDEIDKLDAIMSLIGQKYFQSVDRSKLVDGAITGMMDALDDPYSTYMSKEVSAQFEESIAGSFSGIGAEIAAQDGDIIVVSPIKGSPAEKAGVKAKDIILTVNGQSMQGLTVNKAVEKIRGPKGSKVKLEIQRTGVDKAINVTIVRDDIAMETVQATMTKDKIGVIEVTQFSMNTGERFLDELAKLEKQGMKGLVIDVRNNPGGVLSVVVEMANPFIKAGKPIVQVQERTGDPQKSISSGEGKTYPISVLVNGGSASAAEILAGALQEEADATLVGETTFGKGTVQVSYDKIIGDGSLIKMTIAKWLTPKGNWIHKKGIQPNVVVAPPDFYNVARITENSNVAYNMNNADVRSVQVMLTALGYKVDRKDGYFDQSTENMVKQFQKAQNLPETGVVDNKTASKIELELLSVLADTGKDVQLQKALQLIKQRIK